MENIDIFWASVILLSLFLGVLFIRELAILTKLPKEFPDRGLYWFNAAVLLSGIIAVFWGAQYLDSRRYVLEEKLPPHPAVRYAVERNGLLPHPEWIYVTRESKDAVLEYYKKLAEERNGEFIEDSSDGVSRAMIKFSGEQFFLTLLQEDDHVLLYVSKEGKIDVVPR